MVKSTDGAITQACRNGQPQASYSFKMMEAIANCLNLKPPELTYLEISDRYKS